MEKCLSETQRDARRVKAIAIAMGPKKNNKKQKGREFCWGRRRRLGT